MTTATLEKTEKKTHEKKGRKVKLQPLNDRVMIEREEAEERTSGGIVLPDKAREKVNRGKVISVGAGRLDKEGRRIPMTVKAGDRVLINKYGGEEFKVEGHEYLLIREEDILALINE
jgi:chaperonin GroES